VPKIFVRFFESWALKPAVNYMNQSQHFEDVSTLKLPRVIVSPCRYELHLLWFSGMSCRVASDVLCGPGDPLCRPLRCLVSQPASLSIQLPLQSTTDAGLFACLLTSPYVHWFTDLFHSLISTCPHLRRHGGLEEGEHYQNRLCFTVFLYCYIYIFISPRSSKTTESKRKC